MVLPLTPRSRHPRVLFSWRRLFGVRRYDEADQMLRELDERIRHRASLFQKRS